MENNVLHTAPHEETRPRGILKRFCEENNIDLSALIEKLGFNSIQDIHEDRCSEILNEIGYKNTEEVTE